MMLPETVAAACAGRTVRAAMLAKFEYSTGPDRVWAGFGQLDAGGCTWKGMGTYGSVDGLSAQADLAASKLTFKLSGVSPDLVTLAKQSAETVKGRPCTVYTQFFDEAWQPLDNPLPLQSAIMDQMAYEAVGPDQRNITLTAEGIFAARGSAPFAMYTDRDQQARFPGDLALADISSLIYRVVTWPDY